MFFADYRRRRFQKKVNMALLGIINTFMGDEYFSGEIEQIRIDIMNSFEPAHFFLSIKRLAKWVEFYAARAPLIEITHTEKTPDVFCCNRIPQPKGKKK